MTPPDLHWLTTATDAELRRHLLTCDGRGTKAKEAMLDALIGRACADQRLRTDAEIAKWDGGRQM